MNRSDIQDLPRNVREIFLGLVDRDVANVREVRAATAAVAEANSAMMPVRADANAARENLAALEEQLTKLGDDIARIDGARPGLAVKIVSGITKDAEDRTAQLKRADLLRQREVWSLAIESAQKTCISLTAHSAQRARALADEEFNLSQVIESAKLGRAYAEAA